MHILRLFLVVWIFATTASTNAVSAPVGRAGLMTAYEWAGFGEREERIYFSGLLESFAFSGYSLVDRKNQDQIRSYSRLVNCLRNYTDPIRSAMNSLLALGQGPEDSFASIVWDRVVPLVCEREPISHSSVMLPLRLTSHYSWSKWSQQEKVLYQKGFLDAQIYQVSKRTNSEQQDKDFALLRNISTESRIKESVELLTKNGLELGSPIPWSIARANGSLVGRGPGYQGERTLGNWFKAAGKVLLDPWGVWVDFEALSVACKARWNDLGKLTPGKFDIKIHTTLMSGYQCFAQESKITIFSTYFKDMKAPSEEIDKLDTMFSPKVLDDKKSMAQSHLSKLDPAAQISFCQENWEIVSHHSSALIYKIEEAEYLLDQNPQFLKTKLAVQKAKAKCQLN